MARPLEVPGDSERNQITKGLLSYVTQPGPYVAGGARRGVGGADMEPVKVV